MIEIAKEKELYPIVRDWLYVYLSEKYKSSEIVVDITANRYLSKWIEDNGFENLFEDYETYEVKIDITGMVVKGEKADIYFVECKLNKITLRDVSQLLGYSKVVVPDLSLIISPKFISHGIKSLIYDYGRTDILKYDEENLRLIKICKWDIRRNSPDYNYFIPKGYTL